MHRVPELSSLLLPLSTLWLTLARLKVLVVLLLLLMSVVLVFLFVYQNEKANVDKVSESNINGHMLKKKC